MSYIEQLGKNAQKASKTLISLGSMEKNNLLRQVATALVEQAEMILAGNARDLAAAKENGISDIMLDRLRLNHERIKGIAEGVGQVADLQDPIGQVVRGYTNLDGLKIVQKRVPLGVVAMIFESRPNVSVDAFSLAFKTGNAIILRGGRDAIHSNTALIAVIRQVKEKSKVPVIETGVGNCHIYVDDSADLEMAVDIVVNAKTQRPSVCNAAESLVVHEKIAEAFLPKLEEAVKVHPVEFRADQEALRMFKNAVLATEEDYSGLCQCVHSVYRRLCFRIGRGNRYFHPKNARPRPYGFGSADFDQVLHQRQRSDPTLINVPQLHQFAYNGGEFDFPRTTALAKRNTPCPLSTIKSKKSLPHTASYCS